MIRVDAHVFVKAWGVPPDARWRNEISPARGIGDHGADAPSKYAVTQRCRSESEGHMGTETVRGSETEKPNHLPKAP